jgi:hypothetical protein
MRRSALMFTQGESLSPGAPNGAGARHRSHVLFFGDFAMEDKGCIRGCVASRLRSC